MVKNLLKACFMMAALTAAGQADAGTHTVASGGAHRATGLQALVAQPEARHNVDTEADLPVALDPASATATLVHDGTLGQWDALVVAGHDDETITGVLRDGTRVQVPTRVVSAEVAQAHRGQRLHVALGSGREAWSAWAW